MGDVQLSDFNKSITDRAGIKDIETITIALFNELEELPDSIKKEAYQREKRKKLFLLNVSGDDSGSGSYRITNITSYLSYLNNVSNPLIELTNLAKVLGPSKDIKIFTDETNHHLFSDSNLSRVNVDYNDLYSFGSRLMHKLSNTELERRMVLSELNKASFEIINAIYDNPVDFLSYNSRYLPDKKEFFKKAGLKLIPSLRKIKINDRIKNGDFSFSDNLNDYLDDLSKIGFGEVFVSNDLNKNLVWFNSESDFPENYLNYNSNPKQVIINLAEQIVRFNESKFLIANPGYVDEILANPVLKEKMFCDLISNNVILNKKFNALLLIDMTQEHSKVEVLGKTDLYNINPSTNSFLTPNNPAVMFLKDIGKVIGERLSLFPLYDDSTNVLYLKDFVLGNNDNNCQISLDSKLNDSDNSSSRINPNNPSKNNNQSKTKDISDSVSTHKLDLGKITLEAEQSPDKGKSLYLNIASNIQEKPITYDSNSVTHIAYSLRLLSEPEKAIEILTAKALCDGKMDNDARYELGVSYRFCGKNHDCINTLKALTLDDQKNPWVFFNIARAYQNLNDKENAVKYYRRTLEINPNFKYVNSVKREINK
jgi:tetratricopeptide (TPR) repeat protein